MSSSPTARFTRPGVARGDRRARRRRFAGADQRLRHPERHPGEPDPEPEPVSVPLAVAICVGRVGVDRGILQWLRPASLRRRRPPRPQGPAAHRAAGRHPEPDRAASSAARSRRSRPRMASPERRSTSARSSSFPEGRVPALEGWLAGPAEGGRLVPADLAQHAPTAGHSSPPRRCTP